MVILKKNIMYKLLWMSKMFRKRILRIDVLETDEILKTKDLPKTLLAPQLKTISIYKIYYKINKLILVVASESPRPANLGVSYISIRVA